jgi:hypothetical protein
MLRRRVVSRDYGSSWRRRTAYSRADPRTQLKGREAGRERDQICSRDLTGNLLHRTTSTPPGVGRMAGVHLFHSNAQPHTPPSEELPRCHGAIDTDHSHGWTDGNIATVHRRTGRCLPTSVNPWASRSSAEQVL